MVVAVIAALHFEGVVRHEILLVEPFDILSVFVREVIIYESLDIG